MREDLNLLRLRKSQLDIDDPIAIRGKLPRKPPLRDVTNLTPTLTDILDPPPLGDRWIERSAQDRTPSPHPAKAARTRGQSLPYLPAGHHRSHGRDAPSTVLPPVDKEKGGIRSSKSFANLKESLGSVRGSVSKGTNAILKTARKAKKSISDKAASIVRGPDNPPRHLSRGFPISGPVMTEEKRQAVLSHIQTEDVWGLRQACDRDLPPLPTTLEPADDLGASTSTRNTTLLADTTEGSWVVCGDSVRGLPYGSRVFHAKQFQTNENGPASVRRQKTNRTSNPHRPPLTVDEDILQTSQPAGTQQSQSEGVSKPFRDAATTVTARLSRRPQTERNYVAESTRPKYSRPPLPDWAPPGSSILPPAPKLPTLPRPPTPPPKPTRPGRVFPENIPARSTANELDAAQGLVQLSYPGRQAHEQALQHAPPRPPHPGAPIDRYGHLGRSASRRAPDQHTTRGHPHPEPTTANPGRPHTPTPHYGQIAQSASHPVPPQVPAPAGDNDFHAVTTQGRYSVQLSELSRPGSVASQNTINTPVYGTVAKRPTVQSVPHTVASVQPMAAAWGEQRTRGEGSRGEGSRGEGSRGEGSRGTRRGGGSARRASATPTNAQPSGTDNKYLTVPNQFSGRRSLRRRTSSRGSGMAPQHTRHASGATDENQLDAVKAARRRTSVIGLFDDTSTPIIYSASHPQSTSPTNTHSRSQSASSNAHAYPTSSLLAPPPNTARDPAMETRALRQIYPSMRDTPRPPRPSEVRIGAHIDTTENNAHTPGYISVIPPTPSPPPKSAIWYPTPICGRRPHSNDPALDVSNALNSSGHTTTHRGAGSRHTRYTVQRNPNTHPTAGPSTVRLPFPQQEAGRSTVRLPFPQQEDGPPLPLTPRVPLREQEDGHPLPPIPRLPFPEQEDGPTLRLPLPEQEGLDLEARTLRFVVGQAPYFGRSPDEDED